MLTKVKCTKCNEIQVVEFNFNPVFFPEECCGNNSEWIWGMYRCIEFKNSGTKNESNESVSEAKRALKRLEEEFLTKIMEFESKYGIKIQYIDTNLTPKPGFMHSEDERTNSLMLLGEL